MKPPEKPSPKPKIPTSEEATRVFLEAFRSQGMPCQMIDGWIAADSGCLKARVLIKNVFPLWIEWLLTLWFYALHLWVKLKFRNPSPDMPFDLEVPTITNWYFQAQTPDGYHIVESDEVLGTTMAEAIDEGYRICDGAFKVTFSAFSGQTASNCERETWNIGGRERTVFICPQVKGESDGAIKVASEAASAWLNSLKESLQSTGLPGRLHWMRFSRNLWPRTMGGIENTTLNVAVVNNEPSTDLEKQMDLLEWPHIVYRHYSFRIFLIILEDPTPKKD